MPCIKVPNGVLCAPNSYGAAIDDANARMKRGERQLYCWKCDLWRWPGQCKHKHKMTYQALRRFYKQVEKETRKKYPTQEDKYRRAFRRAVRNGTFGMGESFAPQVPPKDKLKEDKE